MLALTDGLGLDRAYVVSLRGLLPATRFAVDAYVRFVRDMPLLDAVAASLTEMFAPKIHAERIEDLHIVAKNLLEFETLSGDEIVGVLNGVAPNRDEPELVHDAGPTSAVPLSEPVAAPEPVQPTM